MGRNRIREMGEKPKVAIYVPMLNTIRYIKLCLDSVVAVSYPNLEIRISDDGSTDGSLEVCREYAKNDSRIRLFERGSPHGSCGDINFALQDFDGEFACKIDSDDLVEERYWDIVLPYFSKPTIGFVSIGLLVINESGKSTLRSESPPRIDNPVDLFLMNRIYSASPFRMEMFRQLGGWDSGHLHPDWDFWLRCMLNKWEWTYCMKPLYSYRRHAESLLSTCGDEKKIEAREYYKKKFAKDMDLLGLKPAPYGSSQIGISKCGKVDL